MQLDLFSTMSPSIKDGDTKTCNKCNLTLHVSSFSSHSGANYLRPECRKCNAELSKVRNSLRSSTTPPADDHVCPICLLDAKQTAGKGNKRNGSWVLDHSHTTDTARGWLCHRCNRAIGSFGDDVDIMKRAIRYLLNEE
jgi:hypothetical protein